MSNPIVTSAPRTNLIRISDMKDGEIGVIRSMPVFHIAEGRVVQRYRNHLITIGEDCGSSWSGYFDRYTHSENTVELLRKGDSITLTK